MQKGEAVIFDINVILHSIAFFLFPGKFLIPSYQTLFIFLSKELLQTIFHIIHGNVFVKRNL